GSHGHLLDRAVVADGELLVDVLHDDGLAHHSRSGIRFSSLEKTYCATARSTRATPRWMKPRVNRWSGMWSTTVASGSLVVPTQNPRWTSRTASAMGFSR